MLQGEKTLSLDKLCHFIGKLDLKDEYMAMPFNMLHQMASVTIKARPEVLKNSFGLVNLFQSDQVA